MTESPRLHDTQLTAVSEIEALPEPHTEPELAEMLRLATARRARTVAIGHGDDPHSEAAAAAFTAGWRDLGGIVLNTVRWPATAASWLRPARRLTQDEPDLYILGGSPAGLAQMIRRLLWSTDWTAAATIGFASASQPAMHRLVGLHYLDSLSGATADGRTWRITEGQLASGLGVEPA